MKKEISLPSTDGINRLHTVMWKPEGDIKAILQISHGMLEYIERYDEFAKYLNEYGIMVIGNDHLGHGHTAENDDDLGYFDKEKSRTVVNDLYVVTKYAKEKYGNNIPYFLLGHSMGSFMARRYIMTYGKKLSGAIICGTGYTPGAVLLLGRIVAYITQKIKGERYRSLLLKKAVFAVYNKKIINAKSDNAWLSREEENVRKYDKNKYNTFLFTVNGYQTIFDVLKFIQNKNNIKNIPVDLPVYLIAGEEDPVGNYGKGVTKIYNQYRKSGHNNISMKLYEKDRHEILNEVDKDVVYEDVRSFIEENI